MKGALISVYNKNDKLLKFVDFLNNNGYQIIATEGTFQYLKKHGIHKVRSVSDLFDSNEILDGRIKTIHPNIYIGILANRSINQHMDILKSKYITPIDIVIVNFYPFFEKKEKSSIQSLIEFIDIGGPSLLRAAAKNFFYVTPIADTDDYILVKKEIENNGNISFSLRKKLSSKAFNITSYYDLCISKFLMGKKQEDFPMYFHTIYKKQMNLRYGENPHQKAASYISPTHKGLMQNLNQLHGKLLSLNNLKDIDVAWKIVSEFNQPTCCTVKHSTPCAVAIGKDILDAFKKTYESDKISSFGGIMALNMPLINKELAININNIFLEIILSPGYSQEALDILKTKKNIRIIRINNKIVDTNIEFFQIDGGILVQEYNNMSNNTYRIVTKKNFSNEEMASLLFANKIIKFVKSNAIVLSKGTQTLGISGGQTNRIWAARQAIQRALEKETENMVLVSDAFFPFRDIVDEVAMSGKISAILQPGGSIRDNESIIACDQYGIAMGFTGIRHFKH
ncbi:bifunctional phosphoribosylaminoimidazolecarboxamide formyltransferase/IMP cyclohydrolase [Blattabacterium cuenoti]|uniref:bifunctional phosphoribosylaminoimidazolecarboxamide formyltransferase/IMP cyclohydrolase n=1 Tax=Blattabacterium cuenoti TaxID=1653831 RepID=UPI00163C5127|nr:bifunctional phosphoribosylaminoimidazolecarboxamide formyltransferase/IMP cyclohydrolase [Blattabacterium cuenoti]